MRIARWVVNNPAPTYLGLPPEARTDMWASYDYMVPGVFLLATEEQSKQQIAIFERAFAEDNPMIEAQQRIVDRTPQRRSCRPTAPSTSSGG